MFRHVLAAAVLSSATTAASAGGFVAPVIEFPYVVTEAPTTMAAGMAGSNMGTYVLSGLALAAMFCAFHIVICDDDDTDRAGMPPGVPGTPGAPIPGVPGPGTVPTPSPVPLPGAGSALIGGLLASWAGLRRRRKSGKLAPNR